MLIPAPTMGDLPRLVPNEDISEVGAQPLVNDPKLGWNTSVRLHAPNGGSHTRLSNDSASYRIRSNTKWAFLAIVVVIVAAVAVAAYFMA